MTEPGTVLLTRFRMGQPEKPALYIGTSNVTLPVPNKSAFPEAFKGASRLTYYASLFDSVEINSSFYKIPQPKTVAKWVQEVPDGFRFTFKLYRELTHSTAVQDEAVLVRQFMEAINAAAEKAGSLLIQFPPGATHNTAALERLLAGIQRDNAGFDACVEFRHPSWGQDDVYRLLEAYKTAIVIHDKAKAGPAPVEPWTPFVYYRFHGPGGNYRGMYEVETLERHAGAIQALLDAGKTVYAYFNNTMGSAVFDALALQEMLTGRAPYAPDGA